MPSIAPSDLVRNELFFDGPERNRKLSRFWCLLAMSAVIATAGIVSDSTATVIGAMIVAPLMTPILGSVVSVVSADLRNLARGLLLVVSCSAAVVLIAFLIGHLIPILLVAESNSQIAGRIHPRLIHLVAALAPGAVGAFALVRADVSDTLPGVAIAISLVPPLAVVGLTLESGHPHQATGALLLFLTNVGAILLSGLIVMAVYRVGTTARRADGGSQFGRRASAAIIVAAVVVLAVPLSATTRRINGEQLDRTAVSTVARAWAKRRDWEIVKVDPSESGIVVRAIGPLPITDPHSLRAVLDAGGLKSLGVRLELLPVVRDDLPGR